MIIEQPHVTQMVYLSMIDSDKPLMKYCNRWYTQQHVDLDFNEYCTAFRRFYKITKITKLRDFQYRLLLNKLVFNCDLRAWGKRTSANCQFCNLATENFQHLFLDCKFTKRLWNWLRTKTKFDPCNNIQNFILNSSGNCTIDLITIVVKQYIYRCKCLKSKPNITGMRKEIMLNYNIDYCISKEEHKCKDHHRRWDLVSHQLALF